MHLEQSCCIACNNTHIVKNGFYTLRGERYQAWRCKDCGKQFTDHSKERFARHRFEPWVLILALQLIRLGCSGPGVSEVLRKQFRITVSRWSVARWAGMFGTPLLVGHHITPTNVWHMDELFLHAKGQWWYVFVTIDSTNRCLGIVASPTRSSQAAKACLLQAAKRGRPEAVVTDGWQGYPNVVRAVFGKRVRHVVAHFEAQRTIVGKRWEKLSNNRIEGWNSHLRPLLRRMRGAESLNALQGRLDTYLVLNNLGEQSWEFLAG